MKGISKILVIVVISILICTTTVLGSSAETIKSIHNGVVTYTITNNIVTVNWGEKPSGGYSIEITNIKLNEDNKYLEVYYKTESPKKGDYVTQGITYPRDSEVIPTIFRDFRGVKLLDENEVNLDNVTVAVNKNIVTISWGEKPTGGYSIEITDLKLDRNNDLLVYYKTVSSKYGDFVTQVITFPTDSIEIPQSLRNYRDIHLIPAELIENNDDDDEDEVKKNEKEKHNQGKGPDFERIINHRLDKAMDKVNKINNRIGKSKEKQIEKFQDQLQKTIIKENEKIEHFLDKLDFFADRYDKNELLRIQTRINERISELEKTANLSTEEKTVLKHRPVEDRLFIMGDKLDYDVAPVIRDGRILVPARIISEYLGAAVEWNSKLQRVTITKRDKVIKLELNNKIAYVNGIGVELDVPAYSSDGRIMVPIRFICDALGESLDYISETGQIDIGNKNLDVLLLILQ